MAFVHGKDTYVSLDGDDLSVFTDASEFSVESDEHNVTTYGKSAHVFQGGLTKGSFKCSGTYDNTAVGPKAIIEPLIGTNVTLVRRVEGTGSGLPQESVDCLVKGYTETNPVADMVKWEAECTLSDTITRSTQ
jgi:hypothetical protein